MTTRFFRRLLNNRCLAQPKQRSVLWGSQTRTYASISQSKWVPIVGNQAHFLPHQYSSKCLAGKSQIIQCAT